MRAVTDNNSLVSTCWDIWGSVNSDVNESNYLNNIKAFKNCLFRNLKIEIKGRFDEQRVKNLVKTISQIKRITKLHLTINKLETLENLLKYIQLLSKDIKLTIKSNRSIDTYIVVMQKIYFKSFTFHLDN